MSRRNNNTLSPVADSPSLLSDESTPDPSTYRRGLRRGGYNSRDYLDDESQQPNQIPDSFLDSLGRVADDGLDSPTRDDEVDHETDDEVDHETDDDGEDDGILGNNLTTYTEYPEEALSAYSEEDKHLIRREVEEMKRLIIAQGNEFTGVTLPTYGGGYHGQQDERAVAEEFEYRFSRAMLAQAGVDSIAVFKLDVLKILCKEKLGKGKSADEKKENKKRTNRFLDGCRRFIKNQFKEKGEGALNAYVDKGKKITMGTVKNLFLQKIFLEMTLNSIENDEDKTLFMTEHIGKAIDIDNGDWTGSNRFNKLLEEEKDDLLEAAMKEKKEEEELKVREAENTAQKMTKLQAKVQVLKSQLSEQKDLYEQQILSMQDRIDSLFAEKSELQKEHRASEKRIRELESQIQSHCQNQGVAGTNSAPNTYQHGNHITNNTTIIYGTPSKPKNED